MADYLTTDTELTAVADAIREKGGTSASLEWPTGYVDAIDAIETGGGSTPKTFSVTLSNPKHSGEANYPPCLVYGCSDLYSLGSPIGQFESTTGTVTVTTSEPLVALKFRSSSMVAVGSYSVCEGCLPIDITFAGEEMAAFYVYEDGSATVSNVDYDD